MSNRFALTVLLAVLSSATATHADGVSAEIYRHPQQLIEIGKRHLNLYCVGKGKPTVLLDSGLGDTIFGWRLVQLQIADFTQVCAYDRAGYGFSDPPPGPSDANSIVADIHNLIRASHMDAPVVYVGHSIAGLYGLLLEAKHPNDVAGEVLIDPSFVNQWPLMLGGSPTLLSKEIAGSQNMLQKLRTCLGLAEKAELTHPGTEVARDCVKMLSGPGQADPKDLRTGISEMENVSRTSPVRKSNDERELVRAKFGNKPLIVLTRSKGFDIPGATALQKAAMHQAWVSGHEKLAVLSTRGKNTIVPKAGHYIQIDQPAIVVSTVHSVVDQLRGQK